MTSIFGFLNFSNDTIGYKKMLCCMENGEYKSAVATLIIPSSAQIVSRQNNDGYREGEMLTNTAFVQKMETLDGKPFDDINLTQYCSDNGSGISFETGKTIQVELNLSIHHGIRFFPNKKDAINNYYS
ncbi:hypothetical protein QJ854_gp902 [Moumouvirus goulette]|uniref:Uncharacterized protein n=1 Tax=Moumouvirus goulette TaxID=1247379 RepID=M1NLK1_9VIRU|nr:hypothetical protein QJ854_gp902 [Moumouvirus goulette]AGF84880.1 hypothetical protein glt_00071 [Moumouvirus goulette]